MTDTPSITALRTALARKDDGDDGESRGIRLFMFRQAACVAAPELLAELDSLRAELAASQQLAADRLAQMQADRKQALVWRDEAAALRSENQRLRSEAEQHKRLADILFSTMALVREYPDFDDGHLFGDAMDKAMRGELPECVSAVERLRAQLEQPR